MSDNYHPDSLKPRDCIHGQLARSCEICELTFQLATVTAERDALLQESFDGFTMALRDNLLFDGGLTIVGLLGIEVPARIANYELQRQVITAIEKLLLKEESERLTATYWWKAAKSKEAELSELRARVERAKKIGHDDLTIGFNYDAETVERMLAILEGEKS